MKKSILLILLTSCPALFADPGWVYHGDLNGDGIPDKIESGPPWSFGTGGGSFVATINADENTDQKTYHIGGKPECFALEHMPRYQLKLWTSWHMSSQEGSLISYVFHEQEMKTESLTINPGDGGTAIGNAIMAAVFNQSTLLQFEQVEDHEVPPNP